MNMTIIDEPQLAVVNILLDQTVTTYS